MFHPSGIVVLGVRGGGRVLCHGVRTACEKTFRIRDNATGDTVSGFKREFMDDDIILECFVVIRDRKSPYVYRISPALTTTFIVSYKYSHLEKEHTRVV